MCQPLHCNGCKDTIGIGDIDFESLEPGTSLDLPDGNDCAPDSKLLVGLSHAGPAVLDAVTSTAVMYSICSAKIYCGMGRDLMVVLYLDTTMGYSDVDFRAIAASIPCATAFKPNNAFSEQEAAAWICHTLHADSIAHPIA